MEPDQGRRHFLGRAATTLAAARFGLIGRLRVGGASASQAEALAEAGTSEANQREPRQIAALRRATEWLNSPPLSPTTLIGKIVVVQFGTYTCINWLRTLPYIRAWAQKYTPGLVLIGVHTPEFSFEKNLDNVRRAVQTLRIDYPIVIDNDYSIWHAFRNQYWPALYIVDARGRVRHHHFGEGEYDRSERTILQLLAEAGFVAGDQRVAAAGANGVEASADWDNLRSPENYVGYVRTENFASPGGVEEDRRRTYAVPRRMTLNQWALVGGWTMGREAIVLSGSAGRIVCRFHARDLHLVMGPPRAGESVRFRVSIDGQPPGPAHGGDVDEDGNGTAVEQRLYQLIRQPKPIVDRTFEIEFFDSGVEAYAFTFG